MGIPRFFKFVLEKFPLIIKSVTINSEKFGFFDNLYLDANCIIYNCIGELIKRDEPINQTKLFQMACNYMERLLNFVKPRLLFYIAFDGPAPVAKQIQQRQRRYKTSIEKAEKTFDTAVITPGTKFMDDLTKYIIHYIKESSWTVPTIIFSGPNVVGEGEHKIVNYIRSLTSKETLTHCMYGLDADLFMLSLGTHCPKFYLLREDQWTSTSFYLVEIGLFRDELYKMWGHGDINKFIDDFIFICFFIGNDFLPAPPAFHDLNSSIGILMEHYSNLFNGDIFLTNCGKFSLDGITKFLCNLVKIESELIDSDINTFRIAFYTKAGIDPYNQSQIWTFCKNYLQGLDWVQYYYHYNLKNWRYFYPYYYSPLFTDLVEYLTNKDAGTHISRVSTKKILPLSPFQQLLHVLPPKCKGHLPKFLQEIYDTDLIQYYPENIEFDRAHKIYEWETIVKLPFIPIDELLFIYDKAKEGKSGTIFARDKCAEMPIVFKE